MSYVAVVPEAVKLAASDLVNLGSTISAASTAAAGPTTSVVAAAQDEVSTAIAAFFGSHAQQFRSLSARAAAFLDQFVQALTGGAASYGEAEAENALALLVGSPAGALSAAAAGPAEDAGIFTIFQKLAEFAGRAVGAQVDRAIWKQGVAAIAKRTQEIVATGVKILSQDGVEIFTNGQQIVVSGSKIPGLFEPDFFLKAIVDPNYKKIWNFNLNPNDVRSLLGSELYAFARGDGLAQSFFQRVGNQVYQFDTNAQGEILRYYKTTEAVFNDFVRQAPLIEQALGDARRAVEQAEQEFLRQAEQATRKLAEQAEKEAQIAIQEARIAYYNSTGMRF